MGKRGITGMLLMASGVFLIGLPQDWVETWIGVEPDGGSGLLELVLAGGFLACGVVLMVGAARRRHFLAELDTGRRSR